MQPNDSDVTITMYNFEENLLSMVGCAHTSAATHTVNAEPTVLDVDTMLKAIAEVEEMIAKFDEPFRTFMAEQGCDPKDGYVLWLPIHMRDEVGPVPSFVLFGRGVTVPMITRDFRHNTFEFNYTNVV